MKSMNINNREKETMKIRQRKQIKRKNGSQRAEIGEEERDRGK